jgi:hypothetical protein
MRRLLAAILLSFPFLLGIPAHAQRPPELQGYLGEPHYNRRLFWAEVGAYSAANLADGITTVRNSHDHFIEQPFPRGSQELLGRYPTTLRYTVVMGAMEMGSVLLAHRLERSDSRFLRILGHSLILTATVAHADGAIHNVVTPGVR